MGQKKNVKNKTVNDRGNLFVKRQKKLPVSWSGVIVQIYLAVMLGILPLYFYKNLFDLNNVKYLFFRTATLIMLALLAVELVSNRISMRDGKDLKQMRLNSIWELAKKRMADWSVTDFAVFAYVFAAMLSWLLSEWRAEAWIGDKNWLMGLLSQLLLVGIYFAVSRFCFYREWMFWVMGGSSALVSLIAYLHRFSIDPFGLRNGNFNLLFLGTIGQATLHSAYICVTLSFVTGGYLFFWRGSDRDARLRRSLAALIIFLGFCTAVTQNSDSIYVGLGAVLLFLLWFAMEEGEIWRRYLEVFILAVSAAKFTGILQNIFPDRVLPLDTLSFVVTKGKGGWLVLAAIVLVYVLTCQIRKMVGGRTLFFQTEKLVCFFHRLRMVVYLLLAMSAAGLLIFIGLATTGKISIGEGILQQTGYLVFDKSWGSSRGFIWILSASVFFEYSLLRKLFGCGPDMLGNYLTSYHGETIREWWGNTRVTNAHNEWLNAVIDYGIIGGITYITIFASAIVRMIRNRESHPYLLAAAGCVLGYVTHNLFCYQQAVCTPLIFIVIGLAEGMIRMGANKGRNI